MRTAGAYHPNNLLYFVEFFGGQDAFESLWQDGDLPSIDWTAYFDGAALAAWKVILAWPVKERVLPTEEEDKAAAILADVFDDPGIWLPFRVPSIAEMEVDSELGDFYADLTSAKALLSPQMYISLVGNFFRPSALAAALGKGAPDGLAAFLGRAATMLIRQPSPLAPSQLREAFQLLAAKVLQELAAADANANKGVDGPSGGSKGRKKVPSGCKSNMVRSPFSCKAGEYTDAWIHGIASAPSARVPGIRQTQSVRSVPALSVPKLVTRQDLAFQMVDPHHWPLLTQVLYDTPRVACDLPSLSDLAPSQVLSLVSDRIPGTTGVWISKPPAILTFKVEAEADRDAAPSLQRKIVLLVYDAQGQLGCFVFDDVAALAVPLQAELHRAPSFRVVTDSTSWRIAPPPTTELLPAGSHAAELTFGVATVGTAVSNVWRVPEVGSVFSTPPIAAKLVPVVAALVCLAIPGWPDGLHLPDAARWPSPGSKPSFAWLEQHCAQVLRAIVQFQGCCYDLISCRVVIVDKGTWRNLFGGPRPTAIAFAELFKARRQKLELTVTKDGVVQPISHLDVLIFVVLKLSHTAAFSVFTIPLRQHEAEAVFAGGA